MKLKSFSQSMIGLIIIGLGVGFLLDATRIVDFAALLDTWWPILIITAGFISLISNRRIVWPAFIIGVGALLQMRELQMLSFDIWSLVWPAALILVGLSFIFERGRGTAPKAAAPIEAAYTESQTAKPRTSPKDNAAARDERVNIFAAFGGVTRRVSDARFTGGDISAVFGGAELDLRGASLADGAVIEVFAAFGGVEIKVPAGWVVRASGLPLFGGWEDKSNKPAEPGAPVLNVKGTVLFGGFEIKN